jgi:branched-chain amino acid transport system permease protein
VKRPDAILLVVTVALVALPVAGDAYVLRLGTIACLYGTLALSWNLIGGVTGYPSFATAAFFGLGAYTGGVLVSRGVMLAVAVAAAAVGTLAFATLLGSVLLRLRGHYFAIASLSLAEVLRELANSATDLTGGGMGLNVPVVAGSSIMADATFFYGAMWIILLATVGMVLLVGSSRLGFGLACIRQNETAAGTLGLDATVYKSVAFGLSAVAPGAAGAVYAAWTHYIEPTDVFDILYSVKPIVMALIGGMGSPLGVAAGAFVYLGLEELVWRNYIQIHTGVLGVLIVLLLLFLPRGLTSLDRVAVWRRARHG